MSSPLQIVLRPSGVSATSGGAPGWSPVLAVVADGARRVVKVVDWTGGGGSKPAADLYLGPAGYVTNIADAIDVRGPVTYDPTLTAIDSMLVRNPTTGGIYRLRLVGDSDDTTEPKWEKV